MGLISLIYGSTATKPMTDLELMSLLGQSRSSNNMIGITGMLLYHDGNFLQVLEGEEAVVESLYEKIEQDPRHHNSLIIATRTIDSRDYGNWAMSFKTLEEADLTHIEGFTDFLENPLAVENFVGKPSFAGRFLNAFKQNING